jgi:putative ABC transport system permease protein
MLKNLITVAIRNIRKDKGYSILNILGLTIGITFSLLLVFYVLDELSFDRHHKKADRIYRIVSHATEPNNTMHWAVTQLPLGPVLKKDYPEVEHAARFVANSPKMYGNGDRKFYETKIFFADSSLFEIFTHRFLDGDPRTALTAPNSMVLTRSLAEKYFGKAEIARGKSLETADGKVLNITAVIDNVPKSSHIIFDGLISVSSLPNNPDGGWGNFGHYTYVLLKPNANPQAFEKKLVPLYDKFMAPIFAQYNIKIRYGIQRITDIHLRSDLTAEPEALGSMSYVYIFSAIAFFLLLIACINYMNLTTARSARRSKEIGIRKVAGSSRLQLVTQFLVESAVITIISFLLSLALLYFLLPVFNELSGKQISFGYIFQPLSLIAVISVVLLVGLLGGSYPAFYLARFKPVSVLKGTLSSAAGNVGLRRVLVTTQFSISMVMIICTWVIYGQLQYMREKELGFDKERMIAMNVNAGPGTGKKVNAFRNELKTSPSVKRVSTASSGPGHDTYFLLFSMETKDGFIDKGVDCYNIDEDYLATMGLTLVKGRNFSTPSDTSRSIIINENMAKAYGWDEPLGKKIKFPGDSTGATVEVVGVVKDFHQESLYNPIKPLIFFYTPFNAGIQVKLGEQNIQASLKDIEAIWKRHFPAMPFSYTFLEEDFNLQYAADQKRGKIFTAFSVLTIVITCLGLVGLIAFTTEQRQKEISIRKVLGADLARIFPLVAKSFVTLVGFSCLVAFPVAWYFMHRWLDAFPYKAGLNPGIFAVSALAVLLITLITISFHTIKAAIANPVKNLRTE